MANPNLVNVTSILAEVAYSAPANTTANVLLTNAASSGMVMKINSLTATNVTSAVASVTVSVNSVADGSGTSYRLAYQIIVPANASLQIIDKGNFVYLSENKSLTVTSNVSAALEYVTSYEKIS